MKPEGVLQCANHDFFHRGKECRGRLAGWQLPAPPDVHFHMLFLDGVYVERPDGSLLFRWVKAPTSAELTRLAHTIAHRVGRFLERQGLLERLCRYISRPAVSEKRLSLTPNGNVRYDVNGITSVAGAWMRRSDPVEDAVSGWHDARHL